MSDSATATLSADILAPISGLEKDVATAKKGMAESEKLAEKGITDENKALDDKAKLIGQQRQETKAYDADHPFPHPDIKPWAAKPPEPDPLHAFGSWASAFGILAGAITKTGIASSLNASAAAVNAYRKNDLDAYNEAKSAWKDNTEIAIKQAEWEAKSYEHGWELMKTDQAAGLSALEVAATKAHNTQLIAQLRAGNYKEAYEMSKGLADFAAQGPARLLALNDASDKIADHMERKQLFDTWKKAHPDAKPEETAQAMTQIMNPQYTINQAKVIAEGAGGAAGMANDPITINYWAKRLRAGEPMPSLGIGSDAAISRRLIAKKAAHDAFDEGDSAAADIVKRATLTAEKGSLTKLVAQQNAIHQFEQTAIANGRVLEGLIDKVDTTGVPVIERWLRAGKKAIAGDTDVTKFDAQMAVYLPEVAKILSNPNMTGVLSDNAREEAKAVVGQNFTADQLKAVIPLIEQDFGRRDAAIKDEVKEVQGTIGQLADKNFGKDSGGSGAAQSFPDAAAAEQAFKDKKISIGDTINIGGVPHTVGQ